MIFSWNKALARQRAVHMGAEFARKGVNMMLGPVVGPLGRVAEGGRNWEGFSDDPYLSGALVYQTVQGAQSSGVGTCTKVWLKDQQYALLLKMAAFYWERTRDKSIPRGQRAG
jgi:beta-glucosidase